jgi:hypothetical protein
MLDSPAAVATFRAFSHAVQIMTKERAMPFAASLRCVFHIKAHCKNSLTAWV